jgi:hypothetical protein
MLTKNKKYICLCLFIIISVISVIYIGSLNHSPIKTPELKEDIVEHATWRQGEGGFHPPKKIKISVLDSQQEFYNLGPDYKLRQEIHDILNNTYTKPAGKTWYQSGNNFYILVINKSGKKKFKFSKLLSSKHLSSKPLTIRGIFVPLPRDGAAALLDLENLNIYKSDYPISNNFVGIRKGGTTVDGTTDYIFADATSLNKYKYTPMQYAAISPHGDLVKQGDAQYLIYEGTSPTHLGSGNIRCIINLKNGKIQQVCEVIFHPSLHPKGKPIKKVFQKRKNIKVNVIPLDDYYVCNKFSRMEKDASNSYQLEECEGDYAANKSIILNTPFSKYINTISIPDPTNSINNIQYYNKIHDWYKNAQQIVGKSPVIPTEIKNINILKINSITNSYFNKGVGTQPYNFFQNINSKNNFYNTHNITIPKAELQKASLLKILHNVYNNDAIHNQDGHKKKYTGKGEYPDLGTKMSNRYTTLDNTIFVVELKPLEVVIINKKFTPASKQAPTFKTHYNNSTFEYSQSDHNIIFNRLAASTLANHYNDYAKKFKDKKIELLSAIFFKYDWTKIKKALELDKWHRAHKIGKGNNDVVQITFTINNDFNNYHYEDMKYFNNRLSDKTVKDFVTYIDYRFGQKKNTRICYPITDPPYFKYSSNIYGTPYYTSIGHPQHNKYVKINSEKHSYIYKYNVKSVKDILDLTNDGKVDTRDVLKLIQLYGSKYHTLEGPGDYDGDGKVGSTDQLNFMKVWALQAKKKKEEAKKKSRKKKGGS